MNFGGVHDASLSAAIDLFLKCKLENCFIHFNNKLRDVNFLVLIYFANFNHFYWIIECLYKSLLATATIFSHFIFYIANIAKFDALIAERNYLCVPVLLDGSLRSNVFSQYPNLPFSRSSSDRKRAKWAQLRNEWFQALPSKVTDGLETGLLYPIMMMIMMMMISGSTTVYYSSTGLYRGGSGRPELL